MKHTPKAIHFVFYWSMLLLMFHHATFNANVAPLIMPPVEDDEDDADDKD